MGTSSRPIAIRAVKIDEENRFVFSRHGPYDSSDISVSFSYKQTFYTTRGIHAAENYRRNHS
jgi:hypothetical protein